MLVYIIQFSWKSKNECSPLYLFIKAKTTIINLSPACVIYVKLICYKAENLLWWLPMFINMYEFKFIIGSANDFLSIEPFGTNISEIELEQLEHLCSEVTPLCLMITHTSDSYWIPSQKKTKSKLQI